MIDCIVLSTPKRIEWLKKSVESINLVEFKFNKKILSVDQVDEVEFDKSLIYDLENCGWIVDIVKFKNKHLSLKHAIDMCDSNYIFYTEDDIIINKIPIDIENVLSLDSGNKKCGILSFSLGGSLLQYPHSFGDMDNISDRILYQKDNMISFSRDVNKRNNFFIEFPAMFISTEILNNLLSGSVITNGSIEDELTRRYFSNNYHNDYFKQSMCYDKIINVMDHLSNDKSLLVHDADLLIEGCKLYQLLDPNQGGYIGGLDLNKIDYIK